ncbi:PTS glucitol transporter subunit IIA, partial [Klebsiella pneumoniae]|nr:PTS glucitol transporter subunit IIA [Klebsiella pneumoniae]
TAQSVGAFPDGVSETNQITHSTLEGPLEKVIAVIVGQAVTGNPTFILYAVIGLVLYIGLFAWYAKQMKKRNEEYEAIEKNQEAA